MLDRVENDGLASIGAYPRPRRAWTPLVRALAATGDHWTLLIALALAPGRMRLTHLHGQLPGVSTGVLERYLQQMVALGLVTRSRFKEMPPRVELELTDAGRELLPLAGAFACWGMRHMWSDPQESEQVDLDALLRLLPVLLQEQAGLSDGCVEAIVVDTEPPLRHVYRVQRGRLRLDDRTQEAARSVSIEGDGGGWVAAFGPAGDYGQLRFTGDERLARDILDALPR